MEKAVYVLWHYGNWENDPSYLGIYSNEESAYKYMQYLIEHNWQENELEVRKVYIQD